MKHWTTIAALCCLTLLLATGCRSTEKTANKPPEERPAEKPKPEYTSMTFSGEAQGISFNGQLRMAKDSVIWCTFNKIIDLGRAMATQDSVWVRIPLLGRNEAGDYGMVKRLTGVGTTYDELQAILLSDDPEEEIRQLAKRMGFDVKVRIKRRERVDSLTFPFEK